MYGADGAIEWKSAARGLRLGMVFLCKRFLVLSEYVPQAHINSCQTCYNHHTPILFIIFFCVGRDVYFLFSVGYNNVCILVDRVLDNGCPHTSV